MEIRKMAGWCLIILAVVKVFHAIHLQTVMGQKTGTLQTVMISLLFTVGAAFLWLNKARRRSQT